MLYKHHLKKKIEKLWQKHLFLALWQANVAALLLFDGRKSYNDGKGVVVCVR